VVVQGVGRHNNKADHKARRKGAQRAARIPEIAYYIAHRKNRRKKSKITSGASNCRIFANWLVASASVLLSLFYYLFGSSALLTSRGSWIEIVDMCISFRVLV
jgi:hypothetical protein